MERRTITDVFLHPRPDEADAVAREREAGLAELELFARGRMQLGGEQPDGQAVPADGALSGGVPSSEASEARPHHG